MTETASPEPAHANSAAPNGENGLDGHHTTSQAGLNTLNHVKFESESPLSEHVFSGDELELEPEPPNPEDAARQPSQKPPDQTSQSNGVRHGRDSPTVIDDDPPAKRRRVRETTPDNPTRRPKPESPPWKKVEAEGPTTFTEGGRRKSGRINTVPLELQPAGGKRITRRALHGQQPSPPKNRYASTNGHSPAQNSTPTATAGALKRTASTGKSMPPKGSASKQPARKGAAQDTRSSARTRRRSASPKRPTTPTKPSAGTRRSTRHSRNPNEDGDPNSPNAIRTTPRIKLRVRPPLTTIPLVHRDQANIRRKLGPSFEEYFERAIDIPVEDGGLLLPSEDGPRYTEEMARNDAQIILRVEKEVEPGGILAQDRCSVFEPDAEEEPPRQWAHIDHLTKAMTNFRKLMLAEQQRHRQAAKRLALACEIEWKRRNPQPKSAEEIVLEETEISRARWRHVNRAISGMWENVKVEINRRRLVEWEAAEQRRVKAALNQAVNLSEQKLQARQTQIDTEDLTDDTDITDDMGSGLGDDEDDDDDMNESGADSEGDEDNMSSSDDDEDKASVLSDEGLTQEQLREKYANLPSLDTSVGDGDPVLNGPNGDGIGDDTSDESIDMDDDLGSTDEESDEESDSGEDEDSDGSDGDAEESEDEPAGLLGLFFKKSELKKLKEDDTTPGKAEGKKPEDVEMVEDDEPAESKPELNGLREPGQSPPKLKEMVEDLAGPNNNGVSLTNGTLSPSKEELFAKGLDEQAPAKGSRALDDGTDHGLPAGTTVVLEASSLAAGASQESQPSTTQNGVEAGDDVAMVDAPSMPKPDPVNQNIPELEVTEPSTQTQQHSPETDAITNHHSPSRSQSPRTSDTKPSDVETPTSASLLNVPKTDSRLTSPQPTTPRTEIPFLLRGTLREYQHLGLDWLASLYANNTNGILADEMGLGKTIQTIALLAHLACHHEVWGPHLVIVPTSVMLNWEMEFKKWCPGFKILTYYGNQDERKRKRQGWTNDDIWNVCITSYQMVLQDQQVFRRRRWHYMILDEAHNIKNFKSQRWQTLLGFNTRARLLLTGTPLQNNLTELWSLLYFLSPPDNGEGGFADLREFHNWFARPESQILESGREQLDDEARAIIAKLHKVLRPYLLRRLKADVEKQMPAKYEHVEFCRLSKRQRELYDGFLSRNETRDTLASGNYMSIINCLMQLRKVCNHPDLFVDRPIMTSFRMQRSVPAEYDINERIIRHKLLAEKPMSTVSLSFLNMIPTRYEDMSTIHTDRIVQLSSQRILLDLREAQKVRANHAYTALDPVSVKSNIVYLESAARWSRFEELQHCAYLNALRRQQRPIYGKRLINLLTLDTNRRPFKQRPRVPQKIMSWFEEDSFLLHNAIPTIQQRAASMEMTIAKFACVTPAVVTGDMNKFFLGAKGIDAFEESDMRLSAPVKYAPYMPKEPPLDPWHEARMRLTIQFPDKRLLQYDCGKLQALDKLLRKLQAGGHRALIFTQMTKVLDILEQFLNIHGHKYLRLDGSTKVEQRQILTDRFNHDPRILCFILSTRSGGLGINLTGADSVIFYDQDWNPAMDKQCQDRCHRIGQTRDVHIYRLVSEHTIEANILRKASQKQMLDDVVIQEGAFTTDYFNKLSVRDVVNNNGEIVANEDDIAANAAIDRVLGGVESSSQRNAGRVLEQAEDQEDVAAARLAEKEIQQDDADFVEQQPTPGSRSGVSSVRQGTPRDGGDDPVDPLAMDKVGQPSGLGLFVESGDATEGAVVEEVIEYNAFGERMHTIDDYMLQSMAKALEGTPLELPKDKKKSKKKGKDTRKR
ncbi:SNF2 family N-terminal domain-containing protein [Apodospora peruviana]|uniref:DNA helicase n=1 Tax=Apodospora peruviana TaxID=516989 RepID=A0AAE0M7M2_9PEZI|nr:SNF2 family N-terminal domain-containing protein [Apodospora peruviana]